MARNLQPKCPQCLRERSLKFTVEQDLARTTQLASFGGLLRALKPDQARPIAGLTLYDQVDFICPRGHKWRCTGVRYLTDECPACKSAATRKAGGTPRLADELPEIASQWDSTRNARLSPADVSATSRRVVWWRDSLCGHSWRAEIRSRDKYDRYRCPQCKTVLDSLAYQHPELAREWSTDNPLSAWHVRPSGKLAFVPTWVCSRESTHVWQAAASSRIGAEGSGCPECRVSGRSNIEQRHYEASKRVFTGAKSGPRVRSHAFQRNKSWTVDVLVAVGQRELVIEYDGAYWHRGKGALDEAKTQDLLAAGYLVARLREDPLDPLPLQSPYLLQITVHASAPRPLEVIEEVHQWTLSLHASSTI